MKILQLGKFYPPYQGGIESFTYDLTEELNNQGITTDVLCSNTNTSTTTEIMNGYNVTRAGQLITLNSTQLSFSLITCLKKIQDQYDIIHVHFPNPMANLALFITRPKAKIIIHWHSDIIKQKTLLRFYHPLLLWMLNRADKIIATSENYIEGSTYLQRFIHKVNVIPLGINKDNYPEASSEKIEKLRAKYSHKKIIFSLGRLVYYKGFQYLIDAAKDLPDDHVILIGGKGPLEKELNEQITKNKLQEKVFLIGRIDNEDLSTFFSACEIFVLPSIERSEAFGVVQMEAMRYGKPIISTNIKDSGVPWVNKDEVTGVVIPPKDSKAIAEAVIKITGNSAKFLPELIQDYYSNNFQIHAVSKKIISLYQHI